MNLAIFEDAGYRDLLPLTWLRAVCELRCGRDCLIDKIRAHFGCRLARLCLRPELAPVVSDRLALDVPVENDDWCFANARALVTGPVRPPPPGVAWAQNGSLIAAGVAADGAEPPAAMFLDPEVLADWLRSFRLEPPPANVALVRYPWDLIHANEAELCRQCREGGQHLGELHPAAHLLNSADVHIAAGAVIQPGVVLDAEHGPVHIDRDVRIEPNAVVQGPGYIGPGTVIRPGAVLRSGCSLGPVCKVGGEVEGSIIQGYTNKQHDGFLGHSFVAQWVNLGAGTITSDLKNTYGTIRAQLNGVGVETGQHFLGVIIGDHAKTGIGTILPTGGIIGVAANVFTRSVVPKFVPSFAWLTDAGLTTCRTEKAVDIARIVMGRRAVDLSAAERELFEHTAAAAREMEAPGWAAC